MSISSYKWNQCFLCSSQMAQDIKEETREEKRVGSKGNFDLLLKYLLQDHLLTKSRSKEALKWISDSSCSTNYFQVGICPCCNAVAELVTKLHAQLEVIQREIEDQLKTMHTTIVSSSRLYGSNLEVKERHNEFEKYLDQQELVGVRCAKEREFLEALHNFETFVFENDVNLNCCPTSGTCQRKQPKRKAKKIKKSPPESHFFVDLKVEDEMKQEVANYLESVEDMDFSLQNVTPSVDLLLNEDKLQEKKISVKRQVRKRQRVRKSLPPSSRKRTSLKNKRRFPSVNFLKIRNTLTKTYLCECCPFKCQKLYELEHHLREHETSIKNHFCRTCSQSFTVKQTHDVHQFQHKGTWNCDVCGKRILISRLRSHLEKHTDTVYHCQCCSRLFGTFKGLVCHMRVHRGVRQKCELCPNSEPFHYRDDLLRHLTNVHGYTDFLHKCNFPSCSEAYFNPYTLKRHKNLHTNEFICDICEKAVMVSSKLELQRHIEFRHTKIVKCDSCPETFRSEGQLSKHKMNIHNITVYECEHCPGKKYLSHSGLIGHRRIIHGIGRNMEHKCSKCDKIFPTQARLKKHSGTHNETKDFTCDICGFATKTALWLRRHWLAQHSGNELKHECDTCSRKFKERAQLVKHIRTHTKEKPFQCESCGASFSQKSSLNSHKKRHLEKGDGKKEEKIEASGDESESVVTAISAYQYIPQDIRGIEDEESNFRDDIASTSDAFLLPFL